MWLVFAYQIIQKAMMWILMKFSENIDNRTRNK